MTLHPLLASSIGKIVEPFLNLFGAILAAFYSFVPNYPIDVALLTIVIMAALTPLTVKSTKNMAAMQALGPEMKKLQTKYKGPENRVQLNEEMMKLYKEHGVNPLSGCLPMLLQMPAFLVLYSVIKGITNTVTIPAKTVTVDGFKKIIPEQIIARPRYLNHDTKMYEDIVRAHGHLNSFGMDFASKLLGTHSSIWAAIPYALLVLCSVGLQYLQMSRLNARNPGVAQANPQAAMMQKYMPLIFGLIYLNVAAILNVYFIISSSIRIATQEILFRRGVVAGTPPPPRPPKAERRGGAQPTEPGETTELPPAKPKGAAGGSKGGKGAAAASGPAARKPKATGTAGSSAPRAEASKNGSTAGNGKRPAGGNGNPNGNGKAAPSATGASAEGDGSESTAKEHPRSKAKRERKAR